MIVGQPGVFFQWLFPLVFCVESDLQGPGCLRGHVRQQRGYGPASGPIRNCGNRLPVFHGHAVFFPDIPEHGALHADQGVFGSDPRGADKRGVVPDHISGLNGQQRSGRFFQEVTAVTLWSVIVIAVKSCHQDHGQHHGQNQPGHKHFSRFFVSVHGLMIPETVKRLDWFYGNFRYPPFIPPIIESEQTKRCTQS